MKPQMNWKPLALASAILLLTTITCYLLTGLVATAAGYPVW